jgi:hypothetical protein
MLRTTSIVAIVVVSLLRPSLLLALLLRPART